MHNIRKFFKGGSQTLRPVHSMGSRVKAID